MFDDSLIGEIFTIIVICLWLMALISLMFTCQPWNVVVGVCMLVTTFLIGGYIWGYENKDAQQ